jgi:hypothetical protein
MPINKSSRKIQVFGDYLSLTLPAKFIKAHELEKGCRLGVIFGLDDVLVVSCVDDKEVLWESLRNLLDSIDEEMKKEKQEHRASISNSPST